MTEGDAAVGAVKETTVFLSHFEDLPDYRQKGKVAYPLDEVLLLMLAAALAGAETVADIARFGQAKLSLLRRFRPFANGTPSHDQLGIILARLDPVAFQRCFVAWTAALTKTSAEVIAIDGKTVRRSYQKKGAGRADPCRFGLRRPPAHGARPDQGRRQVQRDRRHPRSARPVGHRGRGGDHRRHGLPARNRAEDHRQEGRHHPLLPAVRFRAYPARLPA